MKAQKKKNTVHPSATATVVAAEPETVSENMEVHHHTHHAHGKKNWRSYAWEFLMLFLAVFCGFLAEYRLEHVIEDAKEKQFVKSFIDDLKSDTVTIGKNLQYRELKERQMDSLTNLLRKEDIKGHENELYYLGRVLIRTNKFQSNDGTISQLKYSGSLRLIRNKNAADSIVSYQKSVDLIMSAQEEDRIERVSALPVLAKMYDPFVFHEMLDDQNNINRPIDNPSLRSYNDELRMDFAHSINLLKGSNIQIRVRLSLLQQKAVNSIAFLQKEYDIDQ